MNSKHSLRLPSDLSLLWDPSQRVSSDILEVPVNIIFFETPYQSGSGETLETFWDLIS